MIYLLEDETSIRNLVVYTLEGSGLAAEGFSCAADFWEGMKRALPSLVLLDIMLPDGDGLEVLKRLRKTASTARLPVMMLSARGAEYDKVLGLDLGADDYLPKPFGMMELVSRVRGILRRSEPERLTLAEEYSVDGLFVSVPRHFVSVEGEPVSLTLKEFEMLVFLLRNSGLALTRDQIMTGVWGCDFDGESRTVDVHIRTLRTKLGAGAPLVETVRGVGYRMGKTL